MNTKRAIQILTCLCASSIAGGAQSAASVMIDAPAPNTALTGTVEVRGWAIHTGAMNSDAVQSVTVFVDGNQVGTAAYGTGRPDVCMVFPGRGGCPNVGWTYNLDVDAFTSGSHVLKAVAVDGAGNSSSNEVSFIATSSPLPSVAIDVPADNPTWNGPVRLTGWAIENVDAVGREAVQSITVFVDGNQVGTAAYGTARPDICVVFPGRVGCPNVGWAYDLDVSSLALGSHVLKVAALNTAGKTASTKINFTTASSPAPSVSIDAPAPLATVAGKVTVRGRAMKAADAVQPVAVFVDGTQVGTATYEAERQEAWAYELDTAALSPGGHELKVVAVDAAGNTSSSRVSFTAASSSPAPSVMIDGPGSGVTLSGTVGLRGWAMEKKGAMGIDAVRSVTVLVDGNRVGTASYGTARPDVCGLFAGHSSCPNVGWVYDLDVAAIPEGNHVLKIVATHAAGRTSSIQSSFLN